MGFICFEMIMKQTDFGLRIRRKLQTMTTAQLLVQIYSLGILSPHSCHSIFCLSLSQPQPEVHALTPFQNSYPGV